jgi:hypothetical protein
MNDYLRAACSRLRELMSRANADEVRARYEAGQLIAEVKLGRDKYGQHAVGKLAAELGQDEQTLYRYANVAERWTPAELESMLSRKTESGISLSWSHLVILANVERPKDRGEMLERALAKNLSTRQLAAMTECPRQSGDESSDETAAEPPDLRRLVRITGRCLREVTCAREFLDAGHSSSAPYRRAELVNAAIQSQQQLREALDQLIARLEEHRSQLGRNVRGARAPHKAPKAGAGSVTLLAGGRPTSDTGSDLPKRAKRLEPEARPQPRTAVR